MTVVAGSKPSVNLQAVRYQGRTTLLDWAEDIAQARKLSSEETKELRKKSEMLRIWLKSLDTHEFLTKEQTDRIVYATIDIGNINDFPLAPILSLREKPNILIGGGTTTTNVINQSSGSGFITFRNSDVDSSGPEVIDSFSRSISTGAEWKIICRKTDDSGGFTTEVQATWKSDGTSVVFDQDGGNVWGSVTLAEIAFSVVHNAGNIELQATATTNDWIIEGGREHIPPPSSVEVSNTLTEDNVVIGSALNVATPVDTNALGDILGEVATGLTIKNDVITNDHINTAAAIVYSKLALGGSILNADINSSAAIALSKIANIATTRLLGRTTAGSGSIEELTSAQTTALLDLFTATLKGLVPASGGGTVNFLRADGTWVDPTGAATSGTYTPVASNLSNLDGVTPSLSRWVRVGSRVLVSGRATINPTSSGVLSLFRFDLPIPSTFTDASDLSGTFNGAGNFNEAGFIGANFADFTKAHFQVFAQGTTNHAISFDFSYEIK